MDNISIFRDIVDLCKVYDVSVGVVSPDQEKAFDRVDYLYLFDTLGDFGFWCCVCVLVKLLYSGAERIIRMGAELSQPIPVRRGIRQGCPISGQLFSLAIEPLLCKLRSRLRGFLLPGFSSLCSLDTI